MLRGVDRLLYAEIAERRRADDLDDRSDVLSTLLQARHEDGRPMSDVEIRDELMTLPTSGNGFVIVTTTNSTGWWLGAGASGTVYRWATAAVAVIGVGAFTLSFRALRDLLIQTGTPSAWAWVFPVIIIDTAVGVCTLMLVALGDKPVRRTRTVDASASEQVRATAPTAPAPVSAPPRPHSVRADRVATSAESAPDQHAGAGRITPHSHRPWSMQVRPRSP